MKQSGWIPRLLPGAAFFLAIAGVAFCIDLGATGAVKGVGKGKGLAEKAEKVSVPSTPSGSAVAVVGSTRTYTTGGASSSLGHTVEYRFNWGDGAYSSWGTGTSASHAWTAGGTCTVKAESRCQTHTGVTAVSAALTVVIVVDAGTEVLIPAGNFNMGDVYFSDATPVHVVYLDAYYMDKYEVTFTQYDAFCVATSRGLPSDSGFGRGSRPVINVTWFDVDAYCAWAGKRLPTEAEWERACRAGTDTDYYWGDNAALAGSYAWYWDNSPSGTQSVGGRTANAFGLYDMHGNVWEWVADWYDSGYYAVSPGSNPPGPASGTYKILRGGSWYFINGLSDLRSGIRYPYDPAFGNYDFGCRCARTP